LPRSSARAARPASLRILITALITRGPPRDNPEKIEIRFLSYLILSLIDNPGENAWMNLSDLLSPPLAYEHAVRVLVHVRHHLEGAPVVAVALLHHRHAWMAVQECELLRERAAAVQRQA
jgi:hypothetical protein